MENNETDFSLSNEAKIEYLHSLIGKVFKILHLVEEETDTGYSPSDYIHSLVVELNSANSLFEDKLVGVIVKLTVVYDNYKESPFKETKKNIFEIKRMIDSLLAKLGDSNGYQKR